MNVLDAAYNVCHDHPGGAQALAPRLCKSSSSLSHELTATGTAKLGLLDAVKITTFTGDFRILEAFAAHAGYTLVPVAQASDATAVDCMQGMAATVQSFGTLCSEVAKDLADTQISDNELARIDRECLKVIASVHALQKSLAGRNVATRGRPLKRVA